MPEVPSASRLVSTTMASLLLAAVVIIASTLPVAATSRACSVAHCPTLSSIDQKAGPNTGGTTIVLAGTGFQLGATVDFNTVSVAANFVSSSQLVVNTPSVAPGGLGSFFVAVNNPDGGVSQQTVTFSFYEHLPAVQLISGAAISTYGFAGNYHADVFGRAADNTLRHTSRPTIANNWSAWENLGGVIISTPTAVSWSKNRIDVFAEGSDHGLWHRLWNGTSWSGWEGLGGLLAAAPSVSSWASGRLDVFVKGSDGGLWHKWFDGRWSGWEGLGGALVGSPGAVSWGPNRVDVFIRGTDQHLWHAWWAGAGWNRWEAHPEVALTSSPAAASFLSGDLEVVALGPGRDIWHLAFAGDIGRGWVPWHDEGGYWGGQQWSYAPGTVSLGSGFGADVVEVAPDGSVWHSALQAGVIFT